MYTPKNNNPTALIDVGWEDYVIVRRTNAEAHLVGGIPDYAFALDCSLRQKLHAMPGFDRLARAITSTYVPVQRQQHNQNDLKVGPTQKPEVYQIAVDCARTLGIGVPDIYVENDQRINAYTIACDDNNPLIVVTSGMLDRATPGELKACIGHECGHIHNNHTLYEAATQILIGSGSTLIPGLQQIVKLMSLPLQLAIMSWSRAAEVTADRAGMICSDRIEDNYTLQAKLMSGGVLGDQDFDMQAILRQYDTLRNTPARMTELFYSHPTGTRRIIAEREFTNSEVLYRWRPEWRSPDGELVSKEELDERCAKYIGVFKSEKRGGGR